MTRTLLIAVFCVLISVSYVTAQEKTQLVLADGTILIGKMNSTIEIQTKFGKLALPPKDVQSAILGYNLTDQEAKDVAKAILDLDSPNFKQRDSAQRFLQEIGERAFLLVSEHNTERVSRIAAKIGGEAKIGSIESIRRIEMWISEVKPDQKYLHDYFSTDDSRIKGKILNKQIKITHAILGELTVDVACIKAINAQSNFQTTVHTDVEWKEVCVVTQYAKVYITASGSLDLWPMTPAQYMCGPNGHTSTTGKGGTFMAGALIGKLDNGPPFLIGEKSTVSDSGRLYIKIVENPWNGKSQGNYDIKIERR